MCRAMAKALRMSPILLGGYIGRCADVTSAIRSSEPQRLGKPSTYSDRESVLGIGLFQLSPHRQRHQRRRFFFPPKLPARRVNVAATRFADVGVNAAAAE